MELRKNHYIQIAICVLLTVICCVLYGWYYKEYIKPKSYLIGTPTETMAYEKLAIKDYISNDKVLFSQDINDQTFKVVNGVATYEFTFEAKQYNGLLNDYALFINNDLVPDTQNLGTFKGQHTIRYKNVNNEIFNTTTINIDFSFLTQASTMRVTFEDKNDNLGLLINYFKNNNFIITLCENPFNMDKVQTDDEFGRIECNLSVADTARVYVEYNGSLSMVTTKPLMIARTGSLKLFTVITNNIKNIDIDTDATYSINYDETSFEYTLTWQDANYLNITINATTEG